MYMYVHTYACTNSVMGVDATARCISPEKRERGQCLNPAERMLPGSGEEDWASCFWAFGVGLVGGRLNSCRAMCIPVGGCMPWGPESHVPGWCGPS